MRYTSIALAAVLLGATPVLAQSPSGNVAQPERSVPQGGNTTRGPIDNPSTRDMPDATGSTMGRPAGEYGMSPGAGAIDSAKGGNADQTNKPLGNTGATSGGPAR